MKTLRFLAALLMLAAPAFAQAGWYGDKATAMTYANGIRVEQPLPGASILVCQPTSSCDLAHAATIYTDSTGSTVATNPFTADNQGNFGFWALAGNYQYTFSYKGNAYGPFNVTIGANDGAVVHLTGNETIGGNKDFTGNTTFDGSATFNGSTSFSSPISGTFNGNITAPGASFLQKINNIRYCDQFPGATADVKMNAAIADLPSGGGVVDCRGFGATAQTIAATVNIGANTGSGKTVTMLVDRTTLYQCTITNNTPCVTVNAGSSLVGTGVVPNPNAGFTLSSSASVSNIVLFVNNQALNLVGGYVEGIFVYGNTGATVSDALFGVRDALQVSQFSNITINAHGTNNTVGLKIYGDGPSVNVGNIQFNNVQVDMLGTTSTRPVWIGCTTSGSLTPVACASVNTVTFLGSSALVHPSAGNAIVTVEAQNGSGGTNVVGNINFYGTQLESHSNTDIGILVNGAESVHAYGVYATCNTTCGADVIRLAAPAGTTLDGVDVRGIDNQGGWTNTLNNTVTSSTFANSSFPRLNYTYSASSKIANVNEGGPNRSSAFVVNNTAAPTVSANQVGLGSTTASTVGAAGGATALPATPSGYWIVNIGGTQYKIPYYAN